MVYAIVSAPTPSLVCNADTLIAVQVDPENMAKHEIAPLLEIQLELIVPDIVWIPELSSGGAPGVRDMLSKWFKSFLEIATLIKRLDTGEGEQLFHLISYISFLLFSLPAMVAGCFPSTCITQMLCPAITDAYTACYTLPFTGCMLQNSMKWIVSLTLMWQFCISGHIGYRRKY